MGHRELRTRRGVLRVLTAGTAVGLAGCSQLNREDTPTAESSQYANQPVGSDRVTFGFTVPQTGPFSSVGEAQERGFELALSHLNDGGGWVDDGPWDSLTGDGVLGRTVDGTFVNTESIPSTAKEAATQLIDQEEAVVVAGGGSTNTAREILDVCPSRGVVHMLGFAPGTNVTGTDCSRYGFQEMYNATMAANALGQVLSGRFEEQIRYYQLHAASDYGFTQADQFKRRLQRENWTEMGAEKTRLGTENFESLLTEARDAEVDAVVLSYRGQDAANALVQGKKILPAETTIVVPVVSRPLAQFAGDNIDGVIGTISWTHRIDTPLSETFTEAFQREYSESGATVPSDQAQLAYGQVLQYAAAVERAGTFAPPAVIRELEGATYNLGTGDEVMRACDHQADRPVTVVEGAVDSSQENSRVFKLLDINHDVTYGCDEYPASNCSDLGPYEPAEGEDRLLPGDV